MPITPAGPEAQNRRKVAFFIILMVAAYLVFSTNTRETPPTPVEYSTFMTKVRAKEFQKITVDPGKGTLTAQTRANPKATPPTVPTVYVTQYSGDDKKEDLLRAEDPSATVEVRPRGDNGFWSTLWTWLPMIIIGLLFFSFMRRLSGGANGAMAFGKSKHKLIKADGKVTFDDVILDPEVKESVSDLVDYLRDPKKFQRLGGKMPKGALFIGPPGCGKTLLARALAGEAGISFFSISGSDFVEMFVGVGASRVRDLFDQANKQQPCILFIDEIDGVGRHRGTGIGNGHDEREQTLNQLLVEMDGLEERGNVFICAATNRPDVLDPALVRRFQRTVVVPRPDVIAREAITRVHVKNLKLAPNVSFADFAKLTSGHSGDDIKNLVNEAAIIASKSGADGITEAHLHLAFEKKLMGAERSLKMSELDRQTTAYHEAGHTIARLAHPGKNIFHKVSILARGRALGVTVSLPEGDILNMSRKELQDEIRVAMGGREAELLVFGDMTTGASNDIEVATRLANDMHRRYGMDTELGPVSYAASETEVFLGRDLGSRKETSAATEREIELKVRALLKKMAGEVRDLLTAQRAKLDALALALLERETLTRDEVLALPAFGHGS